jgi:hypothetical protein
MFWIDRIGPTILEHGTSIMVIMEVVEIDEMRLAILLDDASLAAVWKNRRPQLSGFKA